jgi:16S rRNA processing protein RimM
VPAGVVSRPNGLTGALVVHTDPSLHDLFRPGLELELVPKAGKPLRTKVRSAAPVRGGLRLTLDGVRDRNQSEALVGATVLLNREQLALEEGEVLETDILGCEVVDPQGQLLGRLVEVIPTGANDVYVVETPDGGEILVPAVAHAVLEVDVEAGRMTVEPSALEYSAPAANVPTEETE